MRIEMTSMVAKACSSTSSRMPAMTIQEKGSRNKRKFRSDPPSIDPNKIIPLSQNECNNFEFSAEKFETFLSHGHTNGCPVCCVNQDSADALKLDLGLSCAIGTSELGSSWGREEIVSSSDDADWSDLTETQLEELVLSNLNTIFKSAIKKIIDSGYSEEVATKAILRAGVCYGCKDTVSNIVENTLAFLKSGQEIDPLREHCFEDLQQMEKYILAELVCLLREVRPFFSTGDAMWCLLICDMNVSHACAMDTDPLGSFLENTTSNENSSISMQHQLKMEPKSLEHNIPIPHKPNPSLSYFHSFPTEPPKMASNNGEHSLQSEARESKTETSFLNGLVPEEECQNSTFDTNDKPFSVAGTFHTPAADEKFSSSRRVSGITKREYILRQKSIHLEKHYRTNGSKGISRSGKLSSFGSLVLDKKLKAVADSTGLNVENASFKINKAVGFDMPQDNSNHNLSTGSAFPFAPTFGLETATSSIPSVVPVDTSPSSPVADTELSLSLPAKEFLNPMPISYNIESSNCSFSGLSNDVSPRQWVPPDTKDEMIIKLVPRTRELQNQLQEWTEWANQKIMQAARRLSKDRAELKTLRQEKEEVERLKKEKQTLDENTTKKLSEMAGALGKASGQVKRANATVRRLEVENAALRQEMEAAKLSAAESAASCQEVSEREKKTLVKFQSRDKQKIIFQEELAEEKCKLVQLQLELQQAKDVQHQVEARWKQEEMAKEELLTKVSSFRKEREQNDAHAKSKEDMIKLKAENNLQTYKADIQRLEREISELRLKTDSSKIAALRRGIDGSYASKLTDFRSTLSPKDSHISYISRMVTDPKDFTGKGGVKRERECVMCLSEEMSVVFLPCAHQVVCTMCNELHEKQGMKDCPSCRSPIQQRICVRYARC
ncbi:putative E3 ubiquitin-protein ligase [Forsythia ovata]|uniref:E3 ubiquitin-protein ligase n=1 Tax=Forsythia ovata TaxID=205694 RepID=A0ABD1PJK2_9LAMI